MPRLPEDSASTFDDYRHSFAQRCRHAWDGFCDFAFRDNVLEVAVGLIFASAFTAVANSLVTDIILPIISLLPFISRNLDQRFVVLRKGPHYDSHHGYNTPKMALADGAVIWGWGNFVDKIMRFLLIALALFFIGNIYGWATHDKVIKRQVRCRFCRKYISEKAKRCFNCTSWVDGREEYVAGQRRDD